MRFRKIVLLAVLLAFSIMLKAQQQVVGRVLDQEGNQLPFVGIGILNTNIMIASDENGEFKLEFSDEFLSERLTFQLPGYETSSFSLDSLRRLDNTLIVLKERIRLLESVEVLERKRFTNKTKGNKGLIFGFYKKSLIPSTAFGIVMEPYEEKTSIQSISFHVQNDSLKSFKVRPIVYPMLDNEINASESLVPKDMVFSFIKKSGWLTIDFGDYPIPLNEKVLVGVQWLSIDSSQLLPQASMSLVAFGSKPSYQSTTFNQFKVFQGTGQFAIKAELLVHK